MTKAFQFAAQNGVINRSDYPYESGKTGTPGSCRQAGKNKVFYTDSSSTYSSLVQPDRYDWEAMKTVLRKWPVSIGFAASDEFFFFKGSAVFDGPCAYEGVNHGIVAVGFGSDGYNEYVIIRNSWSTSWGERGYAKVKVGDESYGGTCGFLTQPVYPVI